MAQQRDMFPHISDMRIVLLGCRNEGKSSTGNTILGREEFDTSGRTAECVKREGETAGRHITIVEAPGWWNNYTVEETPERDQREMVLSMSLCPPGPHTLLLVIDPSDSFTETYRASVEQHLELLSETVWSHTIVLFTYGDWLGDTSIEQHIESEGEALQWVIEKCGNRYHVVDNTKTEDQQVLQLLEKIEEMVAENSGNHFIFYAEILEMLENKKEGHKRRAEERKKKVQHQREILQSSAGGASLISDMRIVLLGNRYAGKSSSGNTILGREDFHTSERTTKCVRREGETAGRHITVVEAPGWGSNQTVEQTPEHDKQEIVRSASLCPPGPHAILLVLNISLSFTEEHKRVVHEYLDLLGERVWSHSMVLFTRGDWLGNVTIEQHIEASGKALQWIVEKCGDRYHVLDNNKSDDDQVMELLEKVEEIVAENRGWYFKTKDSLDLRLYFGKEKSNDDSIHSSGYGTAEEYSKSGPMSNPAKVHRQSSQGRQLPEQIQTCQTFVDSSTINVSYTECIGRGSYGAVYRGSYQGTPSAVKIISIGNDSVIANEFLIPLRLSHPNIVRMMAVAKNEMEILIANEYIHGANLQQILSKNIPIKLQYEDKLFVALDIAMAVEYIHGKEIIHQDLKPANIMVAADNKKAYLTDWGLANLQETVSMSRAGHCAPQGGTPSYMAPECLVDCEDCSTMSDMWSLGITLLEMFSNSKAWSYSKPPELRRTLSRKQAPLTLSKLQPPSDAIVKSLLNYEPECRTTAKDLVIMLKSNLDLDKRYGYKW